MQFPLQRNEVNDKLSLRTIVGIQRDLIWKWLAKQVFSMSHSSRKGRELIGAKVFSAQSLIQVVATLGTTSAAPKERMRHSPRSQSGPGELISMNHAPWGSANLYIYSSQFGTLGGKNNAAIVSSRAVNFCFGGFLSGSVVENPPANAGDERDASLIPGSGRSLEEGMATHSSILAWRIPWTEEPGGLQSMGL